MSTGVPPGRLERICLESVPEGWSLTLDFREAPNVSFSRRYLVCCLRGAMVLIEHLDMDHGAEHQAKGE